MIISSIENYINNAVVRTSVVVTCVLIKRVAMEIQKTKSNENRLIEGK